GNVNSKWRARRIIRERGGDSVIRRPWLGLNQFDLVSFRCVNKREDCAGGCGRGTIGELESEFGQVFGEMIQAFHFQGGMREVGLDLNRSCAGKTAKLNLFLTFRRFKKDQFRSTGRLMAAQLFESENILVEINRLFQVVDAISCVQKSLCLVHELTIAWNL